MEVEGQQIEMPTPDEKLKFKHHFKKLRCPFVIYADFECLTEELKQPEDDEIKTYLQNIKSINRAGLCWT